MVAINIPGSGPVELDYKYIGLDEVGGFYIYCDTDGANGTGAIKNNVCGIGIRITWK